MTNVFKITIVLLILISSVISYAYDRNCSRIMDEPFKEYQEEAKDERSLDCSARLNF